MSYSRVLDIQADVRAFWRSGAGGRFAANFFGRMEQLKRDDGAVRAISEISELAAELGESYYWAPQMADLLAAVGPSLPDITLQPDLVPSAHGFCWFAKPLPMPPPLKDDIITQDIVAVSWCLISSYEGQTFSPIPIGGPVRIDEGERLGLTFYSPIPGVRGIWPLAWWHWMVGETVSTAAVSSGPATDARTLRLQYLGAAFSLMSQRIIVSPAQRADRATRKRVPDDWLHEPLVRVVQLRRAEPSHQHRDTEGEPVEWSCSWVVRGHWRQQACGEGWAERRPVFVLPHIKGDREKPLRAPADRVFAVTR